MISKSGFQKSSFDLTPDTKGKKLSCLYRKFGWEFEELPKDINVHDDELYLVDISRNIKKWSQLIALENEIVDLEKEINSRLLQLLKSKPWPKYVSTLFPIALFFGSLGFSAWAIYWEIYWASYYRFELSTPAISFLLIIQWLGLIFIIGVYWAVNSNRRDLLLAKRAETLWTKTDDKKLITIKSKLKAIVTQISAQVGLQNDETYLYLRDLYDGSNLLKFW